MKRLLMVAGMAFVAAFVVSGPASAQDAAGAVGTWESTFETPRGSITQQFVFTLTDGTLAGTVSGRGGTTDLEDVRFEDGKLLFSVVRNMRGNSMVQEFSAVVEGDAMKGTMSGGRGGDRAFSATRKDG